MKHRDDTIETLFLHEMDKLIESVRSQMREKLRAKKKIKKIPYLNLKARGKPTWGKNVVTKSTNRWQHCRK